MEETKKLNINNSVTQYHATKDEVILTEIYRTTLVEYQSKLNHWSSTTFMASSHEVNELFDEAFMKSLEVIGNNGGDFVKLFHLSLGNRYKDLLRRLKTRRKYELYEVDNDDEDAATFEIASDFNLEDDVTVRMSAKQKADQRQLIDFLVCGENERTMAIVQAYLSTDLKTPTAIGNHLGLNHKQVIRALNRLAGKFDTRQFGESSDYLVAL
jgi:DNA-directed RNA polymerase specialized sigma24 family protein